MALKDMFSRSSGQPGSGQRTPSPRSTSPASNERAEAVQAKTNGDAASLPGYGSNEESEARRRSGKDKEDLERAGGAGAGLEMPVGATWLSPGVRHFNRIDKARSGSIQGMAPDEADLSVGRQMEMESENAIKYRTCSWYKTAALLFSEYICLAIMSFPYSYSILGLVPGLILTVVVAMLVLYTSLITWEFCLRHPEVRDVCDIGQMLFFNSRWAWWFTAVMFILNNTFIQGFHVLVGTEYLNTISSHGTCTIVFGIVMIVISFICSLPRTFSTLARLATFSAFFTFISVVLAAAFAGAEAHPAGFPGAGPVKVLVIPAKNTSFVNGMSAFLNISYTFIGQITLPSFIAEMKDPREFPKALWLVTFCEIVVFSVCGAVTYYYTGTNYNVAPVFGALGNKTYEYVSFSFMIPTLIFLGVLYASVSARFVFFNLFAGTRHMGSHTVVGWASWMAIVITLWIFAWIIAEVIPFFSDLLSLMSSLFDSFFGFIFWGVAYLRMRNADFGPRFWKARGLRSVIGAVINVIIIAIGFYFLGAGTYVSVQSIINGYRSTGFNKPFSCASNGLKPAVSPTTRGQKRGLEYLADAVFEVVNMSRS